MSAAEIFRTAFCREPAALGAAPGRVNLIGEHIDYNGGLVLPMAIEQSADVAIGPADDGADAIASLLFDATAIRGVDDKRDGSWSDYIAGALQIARAQGVISGPINVAVESDVPAGAGLSSSAAVIVATLKAACALSGSSIDNVTIAQWAQKVEHNYIGVPCGMMDQMAVSVAAEGQALALDTRDNSYDVVDIPATYHFVIVHSGVARRLEDGRYAERRAECDAAQNALDAEYLCHLSEQQRVALEELPAPLRQRARHAHTEQKRVVDAVGALQAADMAKFGRLMLESHRSMRDDFEVSTLQIDALVEGALACGAIGARLTGGGFGGCIVVCVPVNVSDAFRREISSAFPAARVLS